MAKHYRDDPLTAFHARTIKRSSGCLEWTGATNGHGYGNMRALGKSIKPHRFAYEHFIGPIPENTFVLHKCDNRACCEPSHLFLGTNQDNMSDMVNKNRQSKGAALPFSKLTDSIVRRMRTLYATGEYTQKQLRDMFNVCRSTARYAINKRTWKHVL